MKPKPLSALNHFTVPLLIFLLFATKLIWQTAFICADYQINDIFNAQITVWIFTHNGQASAVRSLALH
jgi:hypothetical protein